MSESAEALSAACARWEHFPHDADIGVRGFGPTLAAAFVEAALAMSAVIVKPGDVRLEEAVEIEAEAKNPDLLLLDWLNALVYEMATRHMIFGAFDVAIEEGKLKARAFGEKLSRERHAPAVEVKGATFTELIVREDPPGCWRAQCVIDV
jgi:SHS2 domain-containing protein